MKTLDRKKSEPAARSSPPRAGNTRISTPKQRRRQQDILEVRLRRGQAARQRIQRVFAWLSIFLIIAAIGGGVYLALTKGLTYLFYENPDYKIANLRVETDGVLSRDTVLETADVREGMNIFHVNLDRAKARLEALPQVQKVRLQRQLPSTVLIQISERKPVAWIASDTGAKTRQDVFASPRSYLIDANAILLKPKKVLAQQYNLPIIRGYSADHLAPGQKADAEEARAALDLIRAHQESLIGARFQILEINVSRGYGLMVTDRNGTQVLFGLDDPELQLKTLEALLPVIDTGGRKPATINLMTMGGRQRNIPVTFQQEAPPEPAAAPSTPEKTPPPAASATPPPATPSASQKSTGEKKPAPRVEAREKTPKRHASARGQERERPQRRAAAEPRVREQKPPIPRAIPVEPFLTPGTR